MAPAQGDFALKLTDAPANVDSAVVTVDRVTLVSDDAEDDSDDDSEVEGDDESDDGDDDGPITLTDSTRQIDLLQLQGGVTETLADVTVPEGEYGQLRFVLGSENYIVLDDGTRQSLQVPSNTIRIVLPEVEIENDGDRIEVTLDFDVDESLIEQGNGQYRFKPTIKVKNVFVNGRSIQTVEVDGAVSAASSSEVSVDSIPFAVTSRTEFDGENGASGPADLQAGQSVEIEGTLLDDGTLEAREIEVSDDEAERSITAPVQSVSTSDSTLTQLDVTMLVTDSTEFDDDGGFGGIESGDRVETDYVFDGVDRVATSIEGDDD